MLYVHLGRETDLRRRWRSAVRIGATVGIVRAVGASVGWYVVEHTGGPWQIPAFALALLAWPEGAMLGRHRGPAPPTFFIVLGLLLIVTSVAVTCGVALLAQLTRGERSARR